jgi:hypothetical protein
MGALWTLYWFPVFPQHYGPSKRSSRSHLQRYFSRLSPSRPSLPSNSGASKKEHTTYYDLPVTGASMSIIVFSDRSNVAPSLIIRRAAASSIRPSSMKCCFRTSGRGFAVRVSNTSVVVSLWLGGNGTPKNKTETFAHLKTKLWHT